MAVAIGQASTVIVTVIGSPTQPAGEVGVTVYTAVPEIIPEVDNC